MHLRKGWKRVISPDLKIKSITPWGGNKKKSHTLRPGELATIELHRQLTIPYHSSRGFSPMPQTSTRSIAARLGLQAQIAASQVKQIQAEGKTPKRLILTHSGELPVKLEKGARITRFYFPQHTRPLRSNEIKSMLASGDLVLGSDCKILKSNVIEIKPHAIVYEIPQEKREELSRIKWLSGSKRTEFLRHLSRVEKPVRTKAGQIVITETQPIKLPKNVAMFFMRSTDGTSVHIQSHLIDPGFEGPIVMELKGFVPGKKPDNVLAVLATLENPLVGRKRKA